MKKGQKRLTHDEKLVKCQEFIRNFEDFDMVYQSSIYQVFGRRKYMIKLQQVANQELMVFQILMEDLENYFRKEDEKELVEQFKTSTSRYNKIFSSIIDKLMPDCTNNLNSDNQIRNKFESILRKQRVENQRRNNTGSENEKIPMKINQNYDVYIVYGPGSKFHVDCINDFTSQKIGGLVVCKAIVVRATEVKPELVVGTYACDTCGCENYYQVNNEQFAPMFRCRSNVCIENKTNGKLSFLSGHSKFTCYQELRIQETSDQLKQGKIPRNFTIQVRGNLVKQAAPGDVVIIQGILLPRKKNYYNPDLSFSLFLEASKILREKKKYIQMNLTQDKISEIERVRAACTNEEIFEKLSKSIAPEIYGLENVKKSLLLMMTGGVTKVTQDDLKIRGEINIALFGDPGIAKSQLLKHISYLAPRGVYTTGKGSSGVGLTAAVVRDPNTNQLALEAGALVLADMGVCCIDQFDKMDEYDRTAIHEVMEQQTISIAKAGITTSLNARTSILAAANPLYDRYNSEITPQKNINLSAALLSRFDLIFVLLDNKDYEKDNELAQHIGNVHKMGRAPTANNELFSPEFIRSYIAVSKQYHPVLTEKLHEELVSRYVTKRMEQANTSKTGENYTTMRSLLAILRLAQARARLRFSNEINRSDIEEALILSEESQKTIRTGKTTFRKRDNESISAIYKICKEMCMYSEQKKVKYSQLVKSVLARGYSQEQLQSMLQYYDRLNVIARRNDEIRVIEH